MTYLFITIIGFLLYTLHCVCRYANCLKQQVIEYQKTAIFMERLHFGHSIIEEQNTIFNKYFSTPQKAADTLEAIAHGRIRICRDLCGLGNHDCNFEQLCDFDCDGSINAKLLEKIGK